MVMTLSNSHMLMGRPRLWSGRKQGKCVCLGTTGRHTIIITCSLCPNSFLTCPLHRPSSLCPQSLLPLLVMGQTPRCCWCPWWAASSCSSSSSVLSSSAEGELQPSLMLSVSHSRRLSLRSVRRRTFKNTTHTNKTAGQTASPSHSHHRD